MRQITVGFSCSLSSPYYSAPWANTQTLQCVASRAVTLRPIHLSPIRRWREGGKRGKEKKQRKKKG